MKENKLDKLLQERAQSPMPELQPQPFLATRIAALAEEQPAKNYSLPWYQWSFASLLAVVAFVAGIYLGNALQSPAQQSEDIWQTYSEALTPNSVADSFYGVNLQEEGENDQ